LGGCALAQFATVALCRQDARNFVATRSRPDPDFITAAITLDNELIGAIDAIIKPASRVQREPGYSVGYWLGQPYWATAT
jgi:hypothetical protein